MRLNSYIQTIQIHLLQTHTTLLNWFLVDEKLKHYRPKDGGWTILEILEHITLTSHFLLILIDKGANKAIRNVRKLSIETVTEEYDFDLERIHKIGQHKSFPWIRPEHMEPTGTKSEFAIKEEMLTQINSCLNYLAQLKNGEGLLFKTTMTVDNLGKLNVYEYLYFLSKHAERHIQQMEENKIEFENSFPRKN